MKYAINIINFGPVGDARILAELARDAENAGWDGFFIWDHIAFDWAMPMVDPWVALTAIAMRTERICIGALVTPLARRRPWKFARETASLDHLSGGRLIVGVGLGITQAEFDDLGEAPDFKTRAAMLDEALAVVIGLWSGEPFSHQGQFYTIKNAHFLPTPLQTPRIPIWVAATLPHKAPFRRAARWDGVCPEVHKAAFDDPFTVEHVRQVTALIQQHRTATAPFDMAVGGMTPGDNPAQAAAQVAPYIEAGATWWQERIHGLRPDLAARIESTGNELEAYRWRILQGPPRVE